MGTPEHGVGVLCNSAAEMVTEVRRQDKHGVNFIKMADSRSGATQMLARRDRRRRRRGASPQAPRRHPFARRGLDPRGGRGGRRLDRPRRPRDRGRSRGGGEGGHPHLPTATFLWQVMKEGRRVRPRGVRRSQSHEAAFRQSRDLDAALKMLASGSSAAATAAITASCRGASCTPRKRDPGDLRRFSPMEAIVAMTKNNAFAVGLDGEVGEP